MAKISPFQAIVYNQNEVKDLSKVICPPYDIISPARQKYFHELSPYNLIHMELTDDVPGKDKYEAAGDYFRGLLQKKILVQDPAPAVYFYRQEYSIKGEKRSRVGFLALLKLDEQKSSVFGHEHTHLEAKEDRLKLIRQVKANLSPIFVIFEDKKKVVAQSLLPSVKNIEPFINIVDDEKTCHKLWRLDDPELLKRVQEKMERENIFIADGHHRYEVACAWRDEMKKKNGSATGEESFNYVLAYFTNIDPLGLTVLPIHRLVKLDNRPDITALNAKLNEYFYVEEIKDRTRFFFLLAKAGVAEHVIGMYNSKRYWLLRLRNVRVLDKLMTDKPSEYRNLDVSILNATVLERILNLNLEDKKSLTFSANTDELLQAADNDSTLVAFFLNPTKIAQITSIALKGEKMPPKSTYFYPKVVSGLVVNKHEV
jgi:uncharacterized protein (DUF1015 family)